MKRTLLSAALVPVLAAAAQASPSTPVGEFGQAVGGGYRAAVLDSTGSTASWLTRHCDVATGQCSTERSRSVSVRRSGNGFIDVQSDGRSAQWVTFQYDPHRPNELVHPSQGTYVRR